MTIRTEPLVESEWIHRGAFTLGQRRPVHRSRGFTSSDIDSPQISQSTVAIPITP